MFHGNESETSYEIPDIKGQMSLTAHAAFVLRQRLQEITQHTPAKQAGRSAASAGFDFDLPRPPGGRMEVLRSGSTGMDAGRAVMGQGWPVTACPRSWTGVREPERSEGRTMGQGLFGYFCGCLTKVPRRKGETLISVNRERWICTH